MTLEYFIWNLTDNFSSSSPRNLNSFNDWIDKLERLLDEQRDKFEGPLNNQSQ